MCELELGLRPKEFCVYVHRDKPSNHALLAMHKRVLPIHNAFLPLFDVCHKLGGLGVSSMELCKLWGDDRKHLTTRTRQHIDFTAEETAEAHRQCKMLGINPNTPFVPLLARDNTYLQQIKEPTELDSYRNVEIDTFIPALEYIADRYKTIRMGSVVKSPLKTNHPNILDYSLSGKRTELLDIYLSGKCHFFFSSATGLDGLASLVFRKPVLYVDFMPISRAPILKPGCMLIPKQYWHVEEKRYLTLSELLESGMADMATPRQLNPKGIVVHDNTSQEILEAVKEMTARLDGSWIETVEDKERREQFWSHYKRLSPDNICVGLIGSAFLKNNPHWLR
ncbi:hypothetical protein JCM14722_05230 [Pseudodesulfovibrio portus]|uniref:Uncharacterized protein n=2 Tax=Pseudodesulfovibrio portus TaxID=231439 RepID=A0ABN6RQ91_9BACT|nr:hypothetical protein JCM14722_05230 [Pseudodesulfovibrio portus]